MHSIFEDITNFVERIDQNYNLTPIIMCYCNFPTTTLAEAYTFKK